MGKNKTIDLRDTLLKNSIQGKNILIEILNQPIQSIFKYFTTEELFMFLGFDPADLNELKAFENNIRSIFLIALVIKTREFVSFGQIVILNEQKKIVEVHGSGLNKYFYEKARLSESWFLTLSFCLDKLNCREIKTTCLIQNVRAKKFILQTGFYEVERNDKLILFKLNIPIFRNLQSKFRRINHL